MKVNGKEFYHIMTIKRYARRWKSGKTITYKERGNHLIRMRVGELTHRIEEINREGHYLRENVRIIQKAEDVYNGKGGFDIFDYIAASKEQLRIMISRFAEMHNVTHAYVNLLNELIFERIRMNDFPDLPSRLACGWFYDRQHVGKWWNEFSLRNDYRRIFKVAAYGEVLKVDRSWMPTDIATVKEQFEAAEHYWKGELNLDSKRRLREYLFIGELKVIEEVEPIVLLRSQKP